MTWLFKINSYDFGVILTYYYFNYSNRYLTLLIIIFILLFDNTFIGLTTFPEMWKVNCIFSNTLLIFGCGNCVMLFNFFYFSKLKFTLFYKINKKKRVSSVLTLFWCMSLNVLLFHFIVGVVKRFFNEINNFSIYILQTLYWLFIEYFLQKLLCTIGLICVYNNLI